MKTVNLPFAMQQQTVSSTSSVANLELRREVAWLLLSLMFPYQNNAVVLEAVPEHNHQQIHKIRSDCSEFWRISSVTSRHF